MRASSALGQQGEGIWEPRRQSLGSVMSEPIHSSVMKEGPIRCRKSISLLSMYNREGLDKVTQKAHQMPQALLNHLPCIKIQEQYAVAILSLTLSSSGWFTYKNLWGQASAPLHNVALILTADTAEV